MNDITTIKISKETAGFLNKIKIHPRQPYEEVIINLISGRREPKKPVVYTEFRAKKEITTIKITKNTAKKLNGLKIHPRQPYEEVILKLISENEEARTKAKQ